MGSGIKMRSAISADGKLYTVDDLQAAHDAGRPYPNLFCIDPGCRSPVRFVHRHQQNRQNQIAPVDVPAYIGLTRHAAHVKSCRFNASGRIAIIADQSDPDFLTALDEGKRELRLLALHNGLSGKPLSGQAPPAKGWAGPGSARQNTKQYGSSGEKLDSYLRTTTDLLALRALCNDDDALEAELTLRFGTKRIRWQDFFFERDRFDEAWELLHQAGGNAHPLALVAEVRSCRLPAADAKYPSSLLNCRAMYRQTEQPETVDTFEVSAVHRDAEWLAGFPVGTQVILFGLWECQGPVEKQGKAAKDGAPAITYITHKLLLKPTSKRQILAVP